MAAAAAVVVGAVVIVVTNGGLGSQRGYRHKQKAQLSLLRSTEKGNQQANSYVFFVTNMLEVFWQAKDQNSGNRHSGRLLIRVSFSGPADRIGSIGILRSICPSVCQLVSSSVSKKQAEEPATAEAEMLLAGR